MADKLKNLEEMADKKGKDVVLLHTEIENLKRALQEKKSRVTKSQKMSAELRANSSRKEKELSTITAEYSKLEKAHQELTDSLNNLQKRYETLSIGMTTNENSNEDPQTLAERVMGKLLHPKKKSFSLFFFTYLFQ